jgi:hypothetical protein
MDMHIEGEPWSRTLLRLLEMAMEACEQRDAHSMNSQIAAQLAGVDAKLGEVINALVAENPAAFIAANQQLRVTSTDGVTISDREVQVDLDDDPFGGGFGDGFS